MSVSVTYAIILRRWRYAEVTASLHELVVFGPDRMGTLPAVSFGEVAGLEATAKGLGWTVVAVEQEPPTITDLGLAELRWCKMVRERSGTPRLDDPTHARIYAALERMISSRSKVCLSLRLDYARVKATAALVADANKAWAELKREVEAAGPITADGSFSGLNVGTWLSSKG